MVHPERVVSSFQPVCELIRIVGAGRVAGVAGRIDALGAAGLGEVGQEAVVRPAGGPEAVPYGVAVVVQDPVRAGARPGTDVEGGGEDRAAGRERMAERQRVEPPPGPSLPLRTKLVT